MSALPSLNVSNPYGEILIVTDVKFASHLADLHANCLSEELFASFPKVLQRKIYLLLLKSPNYLVIAFNEFSTVSIVGALILKKIKKHKKIWEYLPIFLFLHYFAYWIIKNPKQNLKKSLSLRINSRFKPDGEYSEILALFVADQFRGKKIGKSMLAYLKEIGIKPCVTSTRKSNIPANKLYQSEKFTEYAQSNESIWYVKN
jgi:ribosomal protein S18 acetylase RimI-like enzyme